MALEPIKRRIVTRGASKAVLSDRSPEVLIVGAAGTGKSWGVLYKIHLMCLMNGACPKGCTKEHEHQLTGMRALMVRKTHKSLTSTGLVTFREQVAKDAIEQGLLKWYGGSSERPAQYLYSNGSCIVVGGMDNPDKIMSAEYDCVIGETLVDSVSPIERAYSRPYSGKLITVTTATGHQLTGTPNHPVLTAHGWRGLGQLREGDDLMCRTGGEQESVTRADPYVTDKPTEIAEVARAFALAHPGGAQRVKTVPMDFHGDGVADGYVDVVSAGGLFHDRLDPATFDHVVEIDGDGTDFESPLFVAKGAPVELIGARYASAISDTLLFAEAGHAFPVLGGVSPRLDVHGPGSVKITRPFSVSVADVTERLSLTLGADAGATLGHGVFESAGADSDGFSGGTQPEFPFQVAADRVVKLSVSDAGSGRHVYNLQTGSHWYVANEIISHNCIFIQEATDLTLDDWEKCNSRLRNGRVSFQQLIADCNPQQPTHWLKKRCDDGLTKMYVSMHQDNPRIANEDGSLTAYGVDYMRRLDNLTGVRKERLRWGRWAAAEGMIYEDWRQDVHLSDRKLLPLDWPRIWGIDFGYTNPFVWQMWAIDPDGRMYLEREIYRTKRLVEDHVRDIKRVVQRADGTWKYPRPMAIVCDHDAEDRATFERHMELSTIAANKNVSEGIQASQARMRVQDDGLPRLFVCRDSLVDVDVELREAGKPTRYADEVEGYVWEPSADGKPVKDKPLKINDHSMDTWRYVVAHLDLAPRVSVRFFNP